MTSCVAVPTKKYHSGMAGLQFYFSGFSFSVHSNNIGIISASYHLLLSFSNTHYKFYNKKVCEKMSIQYMVLVFEIKTLETRVSSNNH